MPTTFALPAGTRPAVFRRSATVILAVAVTASLLSSCARREHADAAPAAVETPSIDGNVGVVEDVGPPEPGGKVVYALNAETNGWNPGVNQWATSGTQVASALFDTLAAYDEHARVRPFLAQSLEPNADYTSWTIRLRPGVQLSNGRTVDASVVVRNLTYLKASPITGPVFTYVKGFEAEGTDRVRVDLTEPWVSFPSLLTTQVGVVADPDWLESNNGTSPIGTGPFTLVDWQVGSVLRADRNPHYWQRDAAGNAYPYLDSIEFRVLPDGASREAALRNGDADLAAFPEPEQVKHFRSDAGAYQVFSNEQSESTERFVMLNTAVPPFDDLDARRALAYATDAVAHNEAENGGLWATADGPFATSSPWYEPTGFPAHDPDRARELVAAVKARHGSFSFTIGTGGGVEAATQLQVLVEQWAEVGIDAKVELMDQAKGIIFVVQGQYQAAMWEGFASVDPILYATWVDPANHRPVPEFSLNFSRINDPAIGEAFRRARAATDDATTRKELSNVTRRLAELVPYVWLSHMEHSFVASDRVVDVTNWTLPDGRKGLPQASGVHRLHQIWLRR